LPPDEPKRISPEQAADLQQKILSDHKRNPA
jgi:hypothetical protein